MKQINQALDRIITIALKYTFYLILSTVLYCWFNPQAVRQWYNEFNNIEQTPCDIIQKEIELEQVKTRKLQMIRINKNIGK